MKDYQVKMIIAITLIMAWIGTFALIHYETSYLNSQQINEIGCKEFSKDCSCSQLSKWYDTESLANGQKTLAIQIQRGCVIQ